MAKYIEVEAFRRKLIDEKGFYPAIVARALEQMPAADVEEVKHGEWLDCVETGTTVAGITNSGFVGYKCSLCGRYEGKKEPYCNCGAKMDRERGDT